MPDVARVVEERAALLDRVEVLRERLELVPRHAREERVGRHVLDVLQRADEQLAVLGPHRRDREAAVAGDDRRHAVPARRGERRVPEDLRVVVRVDVDEAGRDDVARRRRAPASRRGRSPMSVITPSVMATSAVRPGAPVPSTTVPPRITMSAVMGLRRRRGAQLPSPACRGTPSRRSHLRRHTVDARVRFGRRLAAMSPDHRCSRRHAGRRVHGAARRRGRGAADARARARASCCSR